MADTTNAPKPPIRSPFFDFLGDVTGKTRRQLGQLSREWLIFFQEQQKAIDRLSAVIGAGAGGGTGGTGPGAGAPPVIVTASASPLYQRYGNLWRIGFKVDWTAPTNPDDVPAQVLVQKVAPGTPPSGGNQATIDTMQGPFTAGTAYGLVSDFRDALNANADEIWHVVLTPIYGDGTAGAPTTLPVTFKHPALTSVTAVTEIGPRTNEVPDDPTAADLRGLMTTMQFKVTLAFNPGASAGFNPGGGPAVQQVRAWMRYDRGRKNPDGTPAGLIETIPLGSFGIAGQGPPGSTFQVPSVWVTTATLPPATTVFKIIVAIWVSDTMPCPVEDSTNTGTYNMLGGALTPPFSALIDNVVYWTIPGGYAWGWHKITLVCPFNDPNFKAAELTVQKYSGALGDPLTTVAPDYEGIERNFAGTSASRTPYLNIEVDLPTNTVTVTLLTAWTMPAKDSLYRRYVIRLNNTRQDESKAVVTGAWGIAADGVTTVPAPADCMYMSDRLEIIPNLSKAELTATEFDPATIGQGLYLDPNGIIQENTGWNPSQMLPNASYEDGTLGTYTGSGAPGPGLPSGWTFNPPLTGSLGIVSSPVLSGSKAMQFTGSHAQLIPTDKFICRAGDAFYAECWIQSSTAPPPNGVFRIAIFFYDTSGTLISGSIVLRDYPTGAEVLPGAVWKKVTSTAQAPAGAAFMNVVFGTSGTTTGTWYLDNAMLRPILPGDVVQHGSTVGTDANGNLIINTDGVTVGTAAGYCNVNNTGSPPYTTPGNIVSWSVGPGYLQNVNPGAPSAKFGPGMVGQSIVISGTTYTVTGYTAPSGGNEATLTISGSAALTQVPYSIGSVVLVPALTIQTNNLTTGSLGDLSKYSDTIRAVTVVFGLPSLPQSAYPEGALIFSTVTGKIYRNAGGAIASGTIVNAGTGYTANSVQFIAVSGGGGFQGELKVTMDSTGKIGLVEVSKPGNHYSTTPSLINVSGGSLGQIQPNIVTSAPTGNAWPSSPWVYITEPQDIIAGTIAASVIYAGTISANNVTAGTFNGSVLILNANGITSSVNNYADSNLASLLMGLKVQDNGAGHYAAVGPRRVALRLASGLNTILGIDPDPGTGYFGSILQLNGQHRNFLWSDNGGLQVNSGSGFNTGQTATIGYTKAAGGTGNLIFNDGILIAWT